MIATTTKGPDDKVLFDQGRLVMGVKPDGTTESLADAVARGNSGGSGVTLNGPFLLGASTTKSIPTGAKGYLISVITGTATINGHGSIPPGTISDSQTLAAGFDVVTDAASSALVCWNT